MQRGLRAPRASLVLRVPPASEAPSGVRAFPSARRPRLRGLFSLRSHKTSPSSEAAGAQLSQLEQAQCERAKLAFGLRRWLRDQWRSRGSLLLQKALELRDRIVYTEYLPQPLLMWKNCETVETAATARRREKQRNC